MKNQIITVKKWTKWPYIDYVVLSVGLLLYFVLTLLTMSYWSVWFDEAFSSYIIRFNFAEIAQYTSVDVHPPLYYWTLKLWTMVFGTTDLAVRSMSMIFGGVAIFFGFLLVKRLFGRRASWIALLLLILSSMLIRYGQEVRMYTMVAAIAMAATYMLVIALRSTKRLPWVIYGILIALGMWTHYFVAVVWITHWVWRAIYVYRKNNTFKTFMKQFFTFHWVGAYVLAVILFLPWMGSMFHQLFDIQTGWFWIEPVGAYTLVNYVSTLFFFKAYNDVSPWLRVLLFIVVVVVIAVSIVAYRRLDISKRRWYLLLASMTIVPVLLVFVASLPPLRSSFIERYLIPSIVSFSLFTGMAVAVATAKRSIVTQIIIIVLIAGSMIIGIINVHTVGNFNKTRGVSIKTKQVVQGVQSRSLGQRQAIIARTPWIYYEAVFYESLQNPVYYLNTTIINDTSGSLDLLRRDDAHNILDITAFAQAHQIVWYIGQPGNNDMPIPVVGWTKLQEFRIDDPVTGNKLYQAVQYDTRINEE